MRPHLPEGGLRGVEGVEGGDTATATTGHGFPSDEIPSPPERWTTLGGTPALVGGGGVAVGVLRDDAASDGTSDVFVVVFVVSFIVGAEFFSSAAAAAAVEEEEEKGEEEGAVKDAS